MRVAHQIACRLMDSRVTGVAALPAVLKNAISLIQPEGIAGRRTSVAEAIQTARAVPEFFMFDSTIATCTHVAGIGAREETRRLVQKLLEFLLFYFVLRARRLVSVRESLIRSSNRVPAIGATQHSRIVDRAKE